MSQSPAESIRDADVVELRVPAAGSYVALARTVTAAVAYRAGLRPGDIEDLRTAVDEACVLLLSGSVLGTDLLVRYVLSTGQVGVAVCAETAIEVPAGDGSLAWTLLSQLVDAAEVSSAAGQTALRLTKRATA